jgi:ATP synthase protein I
LPRPQAAPYNLAPKTGCGFDVTFGPYNRITAIASNKGLQRPPLGRVLAADAFLLLLMVAVAWCFDAAMARSVLLGGLIFLLPQAWFTWRAFRVRGAAAAQAVVQGFYRAEAGKFLMVTAGFALAFNLAGPLQAQWLFGSYVLMFLLNSVLLARSGAV